jgi:hypothetical protein
MPFSRENESIIRRILDTLELADSPDPGAVLQRLDHLQRALAPEHEFSLLLNWLGRCRVVHRLGQEQLPLTSKEVYRIPDLLAAFEYRDKLLPVLIEVKTTGSVAGVPQLSAKLAIKPHYLRYAELLGLPLLIAWRNGGLWMIFDARRATMATKNYRIDFVTALKENLLGVLAGDFSYRLVPGSAIRMAITKLGPVDPNDGGFDGQIREVTFVNPAGEVVPNLSHLSSLFLVWENEAVIEDRGEEVIQSFRVPESEDIQFASGTFSRVVHELAGLSGEEVNWQAIVHRAGHLAHDCGRLRSLVLEGAKHGVLEPVFTQRPATMPDFL